MRRHTHNTGGVERVVFTNRVRGRVRLRAKGKGKTNLLADETVNVTRDGAELTISGPGNIKGVVVVSRNTEVVTSNGAAVMFFGTVCSQGPGSVMKLQF